MKRFAASESQSTSKCYPNFPLVSQIKTRDQQQSETRIILISPRQHGIVAIMTSISLKDLKANLSRYIRAVRQGGEIEVLDRGTPVALITPPKPSDNKALEQMIKAGVLTRGKGCAREILNKPLRKLHGGLSAAIIEDRKDRV